MMMQSDSRESKVHEKQSYSVRVYSFFAGKERNDHDKQFTQICNLLCLIGHFRGWLEETNLAMGLCLPLAGSTKVCHN
jgi:hypothetical protein